MVWQTQGNIRGPQGLTGRGVASATIDGAGHLIVVFTDAPTSFDLGKVVGADGIAGVDGIAGQNGRGIASAVIDTNGALVISYTDNTSISLGVVKGANGVDGKGIAIAGSVAAYANLPTGLGAADAGKGYLVNADGRLYIWSGTAFPPNGQGVEFRGERGADGPAGAQGPRGSRWYVGSGAPGTIADSAAGDLYLDRDSGTVYVLSA